jgi:hypothetical protein
VEQPAGDAAPFADEQKSTPSHEDSGLAAAASEAAHAITPEPETRADAAEQVSLSEQPAPAAPALAPSSETPLHTARKSAELFRLPVEPAARDEKPATRGKKWFGGITLDSSEKRIPSRRDDTLARPLESSKAEAAPDGDKAQATPASTESSAVAPSEELRREQEQESVEAAAPKTTDTWLADFTAAISEDGKTAAGSEPTLESIKWPALNEIDTPESKDGTPVAESTPTGAELAASASGRESVQQGQTTRHGVADVQPAETAPAPDKPAPDNVEPTVAAGEPLEPAKSKTSAGVPSEIAPAPLRPTITVVRRARPAKSVKTTPDTKPSEITPAATAGATQTIAPTEPARALETPKHEPLDTQPSEPAPAPTRPAAPSESPAIERPKAAAIEDEQPPKPNEIAPDQARTARASADEAPSADGPPTKADRLSDLLAKLEKAMQANTAAGALPAAREGSPQADDSIAVENATPEDGPKSVLHDTSSAEPQGDPLSAPAQAAANPIEPAPVPDPAPTSAPEQLKPDRLSFLLTKLFEAVKRESVEQAAKPEPVEDTEPQPPPTNEAATTEILDLRIVEQSSTTGGDVSTATGSDPQQLDVGQISAAAAPDGAGATGATRVEILEPAATTDVLKAKAEADAETHEPSATGAPQPQATAAVSAASSAPQAQVEANTRPPSAARPRPKAASTGTFGTRRKPPPTLQTILSETMPPRPAAPAETTPRTSLGRDAKSQTVTHASHPARQTAKESPAVANERPAEARPSQAHSKAELGGLKSERVKDQSHQEHAAAATPGTRSDTTFRAKGASGALAPVESLPGGASADKMPVKYYGPKHAEGADDGTANAAQQRASNLAEALGEYYAKTGEPQPPMHTTDRATLQRAIQGGKLEAPRRRGAPWSLSGMGRRGEVVIRLKPGAEKYVEFVPSKESFGQVPHFYQRGVGKGSFVTYVPATHLEYFDPNAGAWVALQRGKE